MRSPFARRAPRPDGPGAPAAPRPRAGVLVLPFSGPRPGARFNWALLTALAVVAPCCLAVALTRDTTFSGAPGTGGAGPEAPPDQAAQNPCEALDRRAAEKQALARAVIEGRLPLLPAAARFRDLNAQPPAFPWEAFRQTYPGDSDDERHGREVLQFVRLEVRQRPGADSAVVGRLEAELQGLLEHGNFRLPGPDDDRPGGR
jgi:hypothetical protein